MRENMEMNIKMKRNNVNNIANNLIRKIILMKRKEVVWLNEKINE